MSDIDSDEAVASIPNMDNEAFKKMIQREMRSCMLETFNQVMSTKRSFPIVNQDITEGLSSHTSDDLIEIRGKRHKKVKTSSLQPPRARCEVLAPQLPQEVSTSTINGGPRASYSLGVLGSTNYRGVPSGKNIRVSLAAQHILVLILKWEMLIIIMIISTITERLRT